MSMPEWYNDDQREAFRAGVRAERDGFRCNPDRDLTQDVIKVETAEYRLHLGYDDVEGIYDLTVTYKGRIRNDKAVIRSIMFDSYVKAVSRVARFVADHAPPRARCNVDY